tara:strand:+ start:12453 stop:12743 length:291 start_codon:yes stop_codon:yes gene_type:complete
MGKEEKRPSLRGAIDKKCRACTYDELDAGTARQQIACCIDTDCPLHCVRPVNTEVIPVRLLVAYGIKAEQLCDRSRGLVQDVEPTADEAANVYVEV